MNSQDDRVLSHCVPHTRGEEGQCLPSRKQLFSEAKPTSGGISEAWSDEENKVLVKFIRIHCEPPAWPSHSNTNKFWKDATDFATDFVHQGSKATVGRSGMIRFYCTVYLQV